MYLFPANIHVPPRRVREAHVDEQRRRGEEVGVDPRDGAGEVVLLRGGEGGCMLDFVEGHFFGGLMGWVDWRGGLMVGGE